MDHPIEIGQVRYWLKKHHKAMSHFTFLKDLKYFVLLDSFYDEDLNWRRYKPYNEVGCAPPCKRWRIKYLGCDGVFTTNDQNLRSLSRELKDK